MKRMIRASEDKSDAKRVDELTNFLLKQNGRDLDDIYNYIVSRLPSSKMLELLEGYAEMSDIDTDEMED